MQYLGRDETREAYLIAPDLLRVVCNPIYVCGGRLEETHQCAVVTNQDTILRGSLQVNTTNQDVGGDCEIAINRQLDVTGEIWMRWVSSTISGGACAGQRDTTRERIYCSFDTHTGYDTKWAFSSATLSIDIGQGAQALGFNIPHDLVLYTGHQDLPTPLNLNMNAAKPDKNRQTFTLGASLIALHTLTLNPKCLYPVSGTEFRIGFLFEEQNNANEQGGLRCEKFYPKLSYTVNPNRHFPFWHHKPLP